MKSVSKVFALLPNTFSTSTSTGQPDLNVDLAERYAEYRQAVEAARTTSLPATAYPVWTDGAPTRPTKR